MPVPEYAALDLETTGLDPRGDRVIEVGAVAFSESAVHDSLDRLVDPGRSVPEQVLRLTGINPAELAGAASQEVALLELSAFIRGRQPVGHGAALEVDFLAAAGLWEPGAEIIDTLHIARIVLPNSASHSLPALALELGLAQPRPHRALDDADATRQLFLRLREVAAGLDENLKQSMLALVAPYTWAIARFFAEALTASSPPTPARSRTPRHLPRPVQRAQVESWDPARLAALLGPDGPLAATAPDYEHRDAQQQMLLACAQIMERGGRLVVEAGTGTGKSLAYLIPAIARAVTRGERVIVSTATHTLQEQLMTKDLPFLREWLPWEFEACLLKGRSNYLSLRRWRRYLVELCTDSEELRFKLKILVWLNETESGDRSEVRLQGREEVFWLRIASDPLDCVGVFCTAEDCFVHRARAEAERADVVVVNHALLLADTTSGGAVLPPFEHLVIDEAHHLEDAATQGLRREVDGPGLLALLDRLASDQKATGQHVSRKEGRPGGLLGELSVQPRLGAEADPGTAIPAALSARRLVAACFRVAADFAQRSLPDVERRDETLRITTQVRQQAGWSDLAATAADAVTALAALDVHLRRALASTRDWLAGAEPDQAQRELEIIRARLAAAGKLLQETFGTADPNSVYWLVLLARTSTLLVRSAPINVGDLLREDVFAPRSSVVFTSASLAVGDSFDYFRQRVGLDREPEMLRLESPFDYLRQALVCLPSGLPDPGSDAFQDAVTEVLADIARRIGGRTLALFTSHHQLRETYWALKQRQDLDDILILGQGLDGQRRQALKAFLEADRALLMGTASFWEGIDVPGDRLSCVVMVRLPFPVPSEPVFAARSEQVRDSFGGYALPLAALRLKQGFGRLIRRSSDRGAVVILDNRISSRDYGKRFLEVLPRAAMFTGDVARVGERIEAWLSSVKAPS